jgi:hypothetical protein
VRASSTTVRGGLTGQKLCKASTSITGQYKYDALKELASVRPGGLVAVRDGRPAPPAGAHCGHLVKLAHSQPGKLNFCTESVGTGLRVTAEMIKQQGGLVWCRRPASRPQVLTELAAG